jgi:hypothetical protein
MNRILGVDKFIIKANCKHNSKFNYSKFIYINSATKGIIICSIHGEFLLRPNDHLNGQGCRRCANYKKSIKLRHNTFKFTEKATKVHAYTYSYLKVDYIGTYNKVIITCKIHGDFLQTPNSHLNGEGCFKCYHQSKLLLNEEVINRATKKHNGMYSYCDTVYVGAAKKMVIICKRHGKFLQVAMSHLNGRGCPKCNISQGEEYIRKELETKKLQYIFQKSFDDCKNPKTGCKLRFDFYIPSKNLLIEYDGRQHFEYGIHVGKHKITEDELIDTQYKDRVKNEYCSRNNISLLRIKYPDKQNIPAILSAL